LGKSSLHMLARCRLRQVPIEYIPVILLENQQERGELRVSIAGFVLLLLKSPLISLELRALFRKLRQIVHRGAKGSFQKEAQKHTIIIGSHIVTFQSNSNACI